MYEKGLISITDPPCSLMNIEGGECIHEWTEGHYHSVSDARGDKWEVKGVAYLPHSCDKWVIGGPNEIRQLISDLEEALLKLEDPNND